jgi:hypothetical protein
LERQKNYSNEEILTLFEESIPTINKQMANLYKHGEIATATTLRNSEWCKPSPSLNPNSRNTASSRNSPTPATSHENFFLHTLFPCH